MRVSLRVSRLSTRCILHRGSSMLGGWSAIGYRFYACAEYDESFSSSFRQHPGLPPALERYGQERDLYGFFVSGLSVIESFFYGLYAIASMLRSDRFSILTDDEKRKIGPQ